MDKMSFKFPAQETLDNLQYGVIQAIITRRGRTGAILRSFHTPNIPEDGMLNQKYCKYPK